MAKRVNTRFLIILGVAVVVMVAAFVGATAVVRKSAATLVRDGDQKYERGDYKGAVESYARAHAREQQDVEILTKLGVALDALASADPENLMRARTSWNEAVTINPRHLPALKCLANTYWDQVQVSPTSMEIYRLVRESHDRLLKVLPADAPDAERATIEARFNLGTLAPWLRMDAPVNQDEVKASVAALEKLAPKDPTNAEIPTAISLAYVKWATQADVAQKQQDKDDSLKKAVAQVNTSLRGQEKNPAMQLAAFQLYNAMLSSPTLIDQENAKTTLRANAAAALAAAAAAVESKPDDPVYVDVMVQSAAAMLQDPANKEKQEIKPDVKKKVEGIYKDILAKRPNDPRARLIAAKAMASEKANREDAIKLFAQPVTNSTEKGAKSLRNREWEVRMRLELVGLRMEKFSESTVEKDRLLVSQQIDDDFQRLKTLLPPDAVPLLKVKARNQLLKGDVTGAIQMYKKAVDLSGAPNTPEEYDLMSELAQAYLRARPPQTGSAQSLLEPIAKKFPNHVPTRLLLANIALDENDLNEAKVHATDLQNNPLAQKSPQVQNLRANILVKSGADAAAVDAFLKTLPEKSREERLVKAQIAGMTLSRIPEATRLLKQNVGEDPKDMASLEGLVRTLLAEKKNDEARQAVAEAATADPNNKDLLKAKADLDELLKAQNLPPAEQYAAAVDRVKASEDLKEKPRAKEIALGDLGRRYAKAKEAEDHYLAAEKLGPSVDSDPNDVTYKMYVLLMEQKRYDDAKPYLEKLARANADSRNGLSLSTRYALSTGDVENAVKTATSLTKSWPEFGESWLLLGQAQQAAGKYSDAVKQYENARTKQGKNAEAIKGIIECYYATGHPTEALAAIREGRQLFPNEDFFRELDLGHEVTYGNPELAIPIREQNYKDNPDDKPRLLVLVEAYGRAGLIKFANDPVKRKLYLDKARAKMQEGVAKWPDDPKMVGGLADVMMAAGAIDEGEKALVAFSVSTPGKEGHQSQVMLANYYMRAGKPDEAVLAMRAALAKSNGDKEVRRLLIAMLAQQRKYEEALGALNDAPKGEPLFVRQRIEVYLASGKREEAETAIRSAMKEMPEIASELRILLATLYIDTVKLNEASDEIEKELAINPNNAAAFYYRAMVKLKRTDRDVSGAMADLQKVRQIDPNNVPSRLLLADAHNASGSRQQAVTELEDALRLAPLNTDVRRRLVDNYAVRGEYNEVLRLTTEAEATPAIDSDPVWPLAASRALAQQKPPDFPAARAALYRAIKKAPAANNAEYFRELLSLLHKAGDDKELLRVSSEMIAGGRKDWWIYQHRGMAQAKDVPAALSEFDKALLDADRNQNVKAAEMIVQSMADSLSPEKALERALGRAANEVRWKAVVAALYQMKGDWANAIPAADEAVRALDATQPAGAPPIDEKLKLTTLRTAASIYHFAKPKAQFEKAKQTYLKILTLQPGDYFALNNIAVLMSEDLIPPDPAAAKEYSQKAYDLVRRATPMVSRVVDTHGWILVLTNNVDEALPLLRSVVDNDPFAEARYHLAEAYLKKGRGVEAEQELNAAKEELKDILKRGEEIDQVLYRKLDEALARARAQQNEAKAQ